eukprot:8051417-Karenia_brevis.AAC.1
MTTDEQGNIRRAKKPTAVMTNAMGIAKELTEKGQCDNSHQHAPLIGGRAKACEVYPPDFCRAICR